MATRNFNTGPTTDPTLTSLRSVRRVPVRPGYIQKELRGEMPNGVMTTIGAEKAANTRLRELGYDTNLNTFDPKTGEIKQRSWAQRNQGKITAAMAFPLMAIAAPYMIPGMAAGGGTAASTAPTLAGVNAGGNAAIQAALTSSAAPMAAAPAGAAALTSSAAAPTLAGVNAGGNAAIQTALPSAGRFSASTGAPTATTNGNPLMNMIRDPKSLLGLIQSGMSLTGGLIGDDDGRQSYTGAAEPNALMQALVQLLGAEYQRANAARANPQQYVRSSYLPGADGSLEGPPTLRTPGPAMPTAGGLNQPDFFSNVAPSSNSTATGRPTQRRRR